MIQEPFHVDIRGVSKTFGKGSSQKTVLHQIDLGIRKGEKVALLGASGSGKSTLMRIVNGLHRADGNQMGMVKINGQVLQEFGRPTKQIRAIRSRIATIFQQFNLVNRLQVITNVSVGAVYQLPLWRSLVGLFPKEIELRSLAALDQVGILDQAYKRARLLSGGQQQRVAIARAIAQGADLILADEPIASLDPESSRKVMDLLVDLNTKQGCTLLVSLHQVAIALRYCDRVVALKAGRIVYDGPTAQLTESQLKDLYGSDSDLVFDELETTPVPKNQVNASTTRSTVIHPAPSRSSYEVYAS
ncbi:MAG: phosphonate/organophosphate ester transporter subunit [Pseudomonadota bacterium]|jgi:phosphonate transport system ATP-binding protein